MTKASMLASLKGQLECGEVLPQVVVTVNEWSNDSEGCMDKIRESLLPYGEAVIVRSSALDEDLTSSTKAGRYASVLDVNLLSDVELNDAVMCVIDSYGEEANGKNEVLVQPFLSDVAVSGVVFTCDLTTGAPYYIINYDDETGSTDSVTSGSGCFLKTMICFREEKPRDIPFSNIIDVVRELEMVCESNRLDVEFAVDSRGEVYVFQVRPLLSTVASVSTELIGGYLRKIYKKIEKLSSGHPMITGDKTLYGIMPDWNPAEMIGEKPRPLALSLYKELITDKVWAIQRDHYGYREMSSCPLMVSLLGHPYIDARISFNSFVPKSVNQVLSEKLVNYYVEQLRQHPERHDKVEFDIVVSCYSLDVDEKLRQLVADGFTDDEVTDLKEQLRMLTNRIISAEETVFDDDLACFSKLENKQESILCSDLSVLEKIYWLVENCKRYGTLPFAGVARAAFIAVQQLEACVKAGFLTKGRKEQFMASLVTVSKQMAIDLQRLPRDKFLCVYGHLRPGTYDILSSRYDETYEQYFSDEIIADEPVSIEPFELFDSERKVIDEALRKAGIECDAEALFFFMRRAIEGRESGKFLFTKSVSVILQLIQEFTERFGISKESASYLDISTILKLYHTLDHRDMVDILRDEIDRNIRFYNIGEALKLPPLICDPRDVYCFELLNGSPNFITSLRVQGEVARLDVESRQLLKGKVVFIRSADPGYDWIFTKGIKALVTMYGGVNSHMAIRAAEQRVPAIIGAGEKLYETWLRYSYIDIDCLNRMVLPVKAKG